MGIWSQAGRLAAQTPATRNRYVDFLRAVSILCVIFGHWLAATGYYHDGELAPGDMVKLVPWTQWLTWIFQVMPIFFIVGGYANAVSLQGANRRGVGYAGWLATRLNRLISPLLVLLLVWALIALVMHLFGVSRGVIQLASKVSLVPIWFLAIYVMVVILAPATYAAWQRWGFVSFFAGVALAALVDLAFFAADLRWLGWTNYFWVWLTVHQLGYAWRDGRLGNPTRLLAYSALGLLALVLLIFTGPYPLAMVKSPDPDISNTLPPKITLLALAVLQFGLLMSVEAPMRRLLDSDRLWTATVLINSMIMTLYLWHMTMTVLLVSVAYLANGFGLGLEPGSTAWWWTRPVWLGTLAIALVPVALLFSPLERRSRPAGAPVPSAVRQVSGAALLCLGVAILAYLGIGGGPNTGTDITAFALVLVGAAVSGLLPGLRRSVDS
jgi:fucose 4-O-acetylase-like acetyltransferase